MMWHFVEEIEHRSSGLILCRHINPDPWYRVKHIRDTFSHVGQLSESIAKTFDEVVPFEDRGASAEALMSNLLFDEFKYRAPGGRRRRARRSGTPTLFHAVPTSQLVKMVWRLALSQTPHHDPADQPLPDWADTWMREYDRGVDMTTFAGAIWPAGRRVRALLSTNYGALVPEDELLTHQIVDTFATVSQSDPSWTEKIWTIAHARDNSLQVVLGIGKYTNRGVFDGAAGVCRGTEQWTVRAGRRLSSDPAGTRRRADPLPSRRTVACHPGEPRRHRACADRLRRRHAR